MNRHMDDDALPDGLAALGVIDRPAPETLDRARVVLFEQIAGSAVVHVPHRFGGGRSGRPAGSSRRRIAILIAASIAAAGAAVAAPSFINGFGDQPASSAGAADFLDSMALRAGAQPATWKNAKWWYSKSLTRQHPKDPLRVRQIWLGHRSGGRLLLSGPPTGLNPDLGKDQDKPGPYIAAYGSGVDDKPVSWDDLWTLPTDPAVLAKIFKTDDEGQGYSPDSQLFDDAGEMLQESPAPPALRAALYQMAAAIPGVRLVGTVKDGLGREGTAIEMKMDKRGAVERFIIDPGTAQLLEVSETGYESIYVTQGPVATDHSLPKIP